MASGNPSQNAPGLATPRVTWSREHKLASRDWVNGIWKKEKEGGVGVDPEVGRAGHWNMGEGVGGTCER